MKEPSDIEIFKPVTNGQQNSPQSDLSTIGKDDISSMLSDQVSDSIPNSIQSEPVMHGPKLPFSFSPIGSWMNPSKRRDLMKSKSAKHPSPILSPKSKKRPMTKDSGSSSFSPKSVQFGKAYYY